MIVNITTLIHMEINCEGKEWKVSSIIIILLYHHSFNPFPHTVLQEHEIIMKWLTLTFKMKKEMCSVYTVEHKMLMY